MRYINVHMRYGESPYINYVWILSLFISDLSCSYGVNRFSCLITVHVRCIIVHMRSMTRHISCHGYFGFKTVHVRSLIVHIRSITDYMRSMTWHISCHGYGYRVYHCSLVMSYEVYDHYRYHMRSITVHMRSHMRSSRRITV
jgi:hypothetical protein